MFDKQQVKLGLIVFTPLPPCRSSKQNFEIFRRAIQKIDAVQECYSETGSFDFLAKARFRDMATDRDYLEGSLLCIAGVQESFSIVAMETVKETLSIKLELA